MMNRWFGTIAPTAALAVVLCGAGRSEAVVVLNNGDSVNLQTLLNGDSKFQVDDKLFTVLAYTSSDFLASNISVVGFVNQADPLSGRGFELTGGWADVPGNAVTAEFNFRYTVEILPAFFAQGFRIVDNSLTFNGATSDDLGAFARVDETVLDLDLPSGQNLIGQKEVYSRFTANGREEQLQDLLNFSPRRALDINKDVKLFAPEPGSTSSISFIRQAFSQIPSPGTAVLLSAGGVAMVLRRRRR